MTNLHIIIRHLIRKEAVRRAAEDSGEWSAAFPFCEITHLMCDTCESRLRMPDRLFVRGSLESVGWKYLRPGFGLCRKCSDLHNKPA